MRWRDTCASWCWCCKLSQQTGRGRFPRPASSKRQPSGNTASELLLRYKQPVKGNMYFFVVFFCFGRKIWLIKWKDRRSLSPCVLWRLLLREKLAVQLRGTQKDSIEFETKVDGRLWSNERWRKKKVKTKTKHGLKKNKHNQNKNNSNKKLRKKRKTNKTRQTPKKINQKLQNQKENKKPSWYRIRKH